MPATLDRIRGVCRDDPEALDLIDRATQHTHGGDRRSDRFKDNNVKLEGPSGNASAQALRRLRKDRPDLHARVLTGELSPHAAAVEAGFRPRTVSVPLTVDGFAKAAVRHLGPDGVRALMDRLGAVS